MAVTTAHLNGVPLDFMPWAVSLYRGTDALPFVIPVSHEKALAVADSLSFLDNEIRVAAASEGGANGAAGEAVISGLVCDRGVRHDLTRSTFTLYDKRFVLERQLCPFDFNMKYTRLDDPLNATYEQGTAPDRKTPATLQFAVDKFAAYSKLKFDTKEFGNIILRDDLRLRGLRVNDAIGVMISDLGLDLFVTAEGVLSFAGRANPSDENLGPLLPVTGPSKTFHYRTFPGYAADNNKVMSAPKRIAVPYKIKTALKVTNLVKAGNTDPDPEPIDGFPILKQVISFEGRYWTLPQLSAETGVNVTESAISRDYFADNWYATGLAESIINSTVWNSARVESLKDSIQRDFRRLFLVDTPLGEGAWDDLQPGKLTVSGEIAEGAVICDFIIMYDQAVRSSVQNVTIFEYGKNQQPTLGLSPFKAIWENEAMGILRLVDSAPRHGIKLRLPGQFVVEPSASLDTGGLGQRIGLENVTQMLMREHARLDDVAAIAVEMSGTLDTPNDAKVWHLQFVDSGINNAQGGSVTLDLSSNLTANKVTAAESIAQVIAGKPDNNADLESDAKRRADAIIIDYKHRRAGQAEILGPTAINAINIGGAISRIDLNFGVNAPQGVSCSVLVERLLDPQTADEIRNRRYLKTNQKKYRGVVKNA